MQEDFIASLSTIFDRELTQLEKEINLYPDEASVWTLQGDIKNSGGTLCLHLCGNLQHFLGAVLNKNGYIRDREHEFAARAIPRHLLLDEILKTKETVKQTLQQLEPEILEQEYPVQVWGYPVTTLFFLIHLAGHLNYHLGQVNYHRRISAASV
ncbi:MAG: DUF1572 family protein [Cyclobacteriaceae bacterium]|nr:DUF1572 family protein [Cyclobacteriaceae bacterium]